MAINYSKVGWDTTKYVNPSNMNQMDNGIKSACDGVDELNNNLATMSKTKIERTVANCNGTNISTHTLSVPMKNYNDRNVVASCTGGSHANSRIDSVIPKSANTIDVVWTANLPSSGTVNVTFMYEIG